jgi:long-subunit fatty acid transport protein
MKKRKLIVFSIFFTLFFCTATAYAQIDQLTNMSVEWIRTGNRNAATDSTDIVVFNPAGLTKMSDGFHVNLSNQTLFRSPEHRFDLNLPASKDTHKYEQDSPDYFLPNFYCAYN